MPQGGVRVWGVARRDRERPFTKATCSVRSSQHLRCAGCVSGSLEPQPSLCGLGVWPFIFHSPAVMGKLGMSESE